MPKLAEAAVAVVGQIMDIQQSSNFQTKEPDGQRVVIATGDGFASVKLSIEQAAYLRPQHFQNVAWMLRYGAFGGRERDASSFSTFLREVNADDLDRLASAVTAKVTAGK